ncbi:MAG: VWA domain-containing protein [Anaerolineae bacterium]
MAGEVTLTTTLNKASFPVTSTPQLAYVLIEVQPTAAVADVRMPLNFGFVLDHSGSMRGEKIEQLREAVKLAIDQMADEDLVSVVVFNDSADLVVSSRPAADRDKLKRKIDRIRAGGGTAVSRGMREGLRQIGQGVSGDRMSRMLLLTDGQTFGDERDCVRLAGDAQSQGIAVNALGLGDDWNEDLLDDIAAAGGGDSDFIDTPDKIVPLFSQTVQRTQSTVVHNAEMILRLVSGVVPRQVWQVTPMIANLGYQPLSERDVQVSLGEIEAQDGKSVLVELMLPPRPAGRYRIAQAEVTYDVPAQGVVEEKVRSDILVGFTSDAAQAKQYDPRVMNVAEKVTAFKLQTRALEEARSGNVAGATQKLRAAATRLLDLGEQELAEAALQEADNLETQGAMSSAGTKKLRYETRKLTQKLVDENASDQ